MTTRKPAAMLNWLKQRDRNGETNAETLLGIACFAILFYGLPFIIFFLFPGE